MILYNSLHIRQKPFALDFMNSGTQKQHQIFISGKLTLLRWNNILIPKQREAKEEPIYLVLITLFMVLKKIDWKHNLFININRSTIGKKVHSDVAWRQALREICDLLLFYRFLSFMILIFRYPLPFVLLNSLLTFVSVRYLFYL